MEHDGEVRLAEVLAAMSLAVDLGLGQPMGHVARAGVIAQRLADAAHIPATDELPLVALMGWVGCIADSAPVAQRFGDDIDYRAGVYDVDMKPLPFLGYLLRRVEPEAAAPRRLAGAVSLVARGPQGVRDMLRAHCQVTEQVARRCVLPESVCVAMRQVFARWDGRGLPSGLRGSAIAEPIRLWQIADVVDAHSARGGTAAAVEVVRRRRGTQFDPRLADVFCAHATGILTGVEAAPSWTTLLAASSPAARRLDDAALDETLAAVGDWSDIKSPLFTGHTSAVAALAAGAAQRCGLDGEEVRLVRRAAAVHGIGRTGVPNTIWDTPAPLTDAERERMRLSPYYTQRMLETSPALREIGRLAATAHERLDGSGYPHGLTARDLSAPARVLAAAHAYRTATEPRPHRAALAPSSAARMLEREAAAGRLDAAAVDAVVAAAAGHTAPRGAGSGGLTPREREVLALIARGRTNKQVARELGVAPKTVGNHIEHIYTKTGVGTRAAATYFAMEHGLV